MTDQPHFEVRLDDRHDKSVFISSFLIGAVLILFFRTWDTDGQLTWFDFVPVGVAVAIIIAYTRYIYVTTNRSSISLDRAGDNAYYLGFLFTLISLSYSLVKVSKIALDTGGDPEANFSADPVFSLIPDFGLALASTIMGIIARVFIQQFRNDPVDIETQARQELGLAAQALRDSLSRAISDMNSTSRSANLAIAEIKERTKQTLEESAETNVALMQRLSQHVDETFGHLSDRVQLVGEDLRALSTELGSTREQVAATRGHYEVLSGELSSLTTRISDLAPEGFTTELRSSGSEVLDRQKQLISHFEALRVEVARFDQKLSDTGNTVSSATEGLEERLASQFRVIEDDIVQLRQKLSSIDEIVSSASTGLEGRLASPLGVIERDLADLRQKLNGIGGVVSNMGEGIGQASGSGTRLVANLQKLLSDVATLQERTRKMNSRPRGQKKSFWRRFLRR